MKLRWLFAGFTLFVAGLLAGLDQLPPLGATLIIGGWPIEGGSGSPARVFALVPPGQ